MFKDKNILIVIFVVLLVTVHFSYEGFRYWTGSIRESVIEISQEEPEKIELVIPKETEEQDEIVLKEPDPPEETKEEQIPQSNIFLSSQSLEQADTLLIRIETEESVSATFGNQQLDFIRSNNSWISIFGIDVRKPSGIYNLNIYVGEEKTTKQITVLRRSFPTTELAVTPELEDKGYTPSSISKNIASKDNPSIGSILKIYTPTPLFNKPFTYPLDKIKIVGAYGNIRKSGSTALQHLGVDLDADTGNSVYAANDGIVVFTESLINYGNTLIIDHGLGIYSLYLHLDSFNALKGESVKMNDIIAFSGNTGYSIEPHLHFSMKLNGSSVDPLRFIETNTQNWKEKY